MDWVPLAGGGADLSQQTAVFGDRTLKLTTKERDVLSYLARNPGRTITRQELLTNVWGNPASGSEEPVYSTIKRLRAKIDGGSHRHVVSVHGDGYRWEPAPAFSASSSRGAQGRFFGREAELAEMVAALGAGVPVVTLVGPGGAGKTRLALELAANRPHVFCDLSNATSESELIGAIAAALGVPLETVEPTAWARGVGSLFAATPGRLVVLDNVEQIIETVAKMVAAWLPSRPSLLVTSREALRLREERVISVGALPSEHAVALLADRAEAARTEEVDVFAAIVEKVERIPLAIELAAVQMKELGATSLLASLDSQLSTLVSGARDAPARHATLRAAVEWSWKFLADKERTALCDLSVFAGAFSAEAARAVLADRDAPATLANLVRRCQVRRIGEQFALYGAVRELAKENAAPSSEAPSRHAEFFARTAERSARSLDRSEHREGAATLTDSVSDLRAAFEHAVGRDSALAGRLALVLDSALGLQGESALLRREMLGRARAVTVDPALRAQLLLAEGRAGAPAAILEEALASSRGTELEGEVELARAERLAATDLGASRDLLERAARLAAAAGRHDLEGRVLTLQGELAWALGLVHEASSRLRSALAIHVERGDRRAIARTSALLAHVDRMETGGGAARALLAQAEAAAEELGDPAVAARVMIDLGQHLTRVGDQAGARAALDLAGHAYERLGFVRDQAMLHLHVAETLVGLGDHDAALKEALGAWSGLPGDVGRSTIHEAIGCIQMLRGELAEAERWIEQGIELAQATGAARSECTLLGKRGLVKLARGDFESAWADFDAAAEKNAARGSVAIGGASLADRAMAGFALGRDAQAASDLTRAREMLHFPPEEQTQGRMLAACEAVGRGFGALRAGVPAGRAQEETRKQTARFFVRPAQDWDVVLRLLDWLIGSIATVRPSRGSSSPG